MTKGREETSGGGGGYHRVQAERDLESNWEVDLAQKLEEYLLKICSGEIPTEAEGHIAVNFAEAALLLQGSVQVYSRKVEYLYSLVLRALEFLSRKRQQEQLEGTSGEPQENDGAQEVFDEENDLFWGLDDIPVEAKSCLDAQSEQDAPLNYFVKPPANLVVLEGDCLDSTGDAGELESYLLATSDLYRGFILLDPCDAVAVQDYLDGDKAGRGLNSAYKGSSRRKSFQSPTKRSGGASHKSSVRKRQDANVNRSPIVGCGFAVNNSNVGPDPPAPSTSNDGNDGFDMDDRYSEPRDSDESDGSDDDDDPWKPLNPHEPGSLKINPFRKVKALKRNWVTSTKGVSIATLFPLARLRGTISPDLTKLWEMQSHAHKRQRESQSPPLYEKLRESLINGGNRTFDAFFNFEDGNDENEDHTGIPDFGQPDDDMPENFMDEDVRYHAEKHDGDGDNFDVDGAFGHEDANPHESLEDLCRSHLDALLASIAETEKQSALAARVTTWKQKIEHNLEEQESHPEFDIHDYGQRILHKLSLEADDRNVLSFANIVEGQEKYDVARSFSALLQLVNNGDADLDRSGVNGDSVCHTAQNPFRVRLLSHDKRRGETQLRLSRKRVKSPTKKARRKGYSEKFGTDKSPSVDASKLHRSTEMPSPPNCKFSVKVGKIGGLRCTPDGKKRRRSRLVEPVDVHSG
ncbi:Condensin-2 complex subunit H [Parasponia andersonii]|uniref:Condensin-2 complex subunit H2 n=1 Tax=Parasponia andersonii TaxID=3476 RepID=A0A2P5CLS9_PARAD|nr:Condensin-2 complex subunit H [Parasponia andersonii]